MRTCEVAVVGTGGIGSAAIHHLAARGADVMGLDRHHPPHDRGSSHGATRVIRQAYFEHPDYVPLLQRAYTLWSDLERQSRCALFHRVGVLQVGPESGAVFQGVLQSARVHGLDVETLGPEELVLRFPRFRVPNNLSGVFETDAGYLEVEACIQAHLTCAKAAGARVVFDEAVNSFSRDGEGYRLETPAGSVLAGAVIWTTGAWAASAFPRLPLEVRRKVQLWYEIEPHTSGGEDPAFLFELPGGVFYGIPEASQGRTKVAEHTGGDIVSNPSDLDRQLHPSDHTRVDRFVDEHLAFTSSNRLLHSAPCMYTMSPDEHFMIGPLPDHPRFLLATGLSGHGFKFASALGEAVTEWILDGSPSTCLDAFDMNRSEIREKTCPTT
ncbi:MAG: N-methyl-L-tryptophan oxidase [Myxococcota bacterium]|nr:N-methyl-L-tryptophan oxidase [Myxococcota bacterium]